MILGQLHLFVQLPVLTTRLSRAQTKQQEHYCGTSAHIKTQRNSPSHQDLPMTSQYQRNLIPVRSVLLLS